MLPHDFVYSFIVVYRVIFVCSVIFVPSVIFVASLSLYVVSWCTEKQRHANQHMAVELSVAGCWRSYRTYWRGDFSAYALVPRASKTTPNDLQYVYSVKV